MDYRTAEGLSPNHTTSKGFFANEYIGSDPPHRGRLVDLRTQGEAASELRAHAARLPRVRLTARNVCDLELLATGAFSPLDRFVGRADYGRVLEEMRPDCGAIFPLPFTLTVGRDGAPARDSEAPLVDPYNNVFAVMGVEEIYGWDRAREALLAYGTSDSRHPMVAKMNSWGELSLSGPLLVLALPRQHNLVNQSNARHQRRAQNFILRRPLNCASAACRC